VRALTETNKKSVNKPDKERTQKPRKPKPDIQTLDTSTYFAPPDEVTLQQALANPQALTPDTAPAMQRTVGNRTTQQMVTRLTPPQVMLTSAGLDQQIGGEADIVLELEAITGPQRMQGMALPNDTSKPDDALSPAHDDTLETDTITSAPQDHHLLTKLEQSNRSKSKVIEASPQHSEEQSLETQDFTELSSELEDIMGQRYRQTSSPPDDHPASAEEPWPLAANEKETETVDKNRQKNRPVKSGVLTTIQDVFTNRFHTTDQDLLSRELTDLVHQKSASFQLKPLSRPKSGVKRLDEEDEFEPTTTQREESA
jgi:hypothetical protein